MDVRKDSSLSSSELQHTAESPPAVSSPTTTNAGVAALKDITFGSIAGAAGKVIEFPFDTIKVRLQSQSDTLPLKYKGPLDCFRQSFAVDGIRGLYRGVSAPLVGASAETACLFFSYRIAQDLLRMGRANPELELPLGALVTAAGMSGAVTSLILTPIELVKCRMQVPLHSPTDLALHPRTTGLSSSPTSPLAVIAEVFRREGLRGFWRGQLGTFFRETGGTAAWFGSYEACTSFYRARAQAELSNSNGTTVRNEPNGPIELPIAQQLASGAVAGVSYNFLFFPADTIKSKIQTGELTNVRPTFSGVATALWRAHGIKGLYRGCGITVLRSAPSSALIFTIMERLKAAFA